MTAFPNLVYSEFDTTQANLLADLRTNILASASWARPNAGSKPDTYKCTTTRGADMVFDLSDAALSTFALTIGVWRSYDGTTFTDKSTRWLYWRNSGGATTHQLHCVVSASKEHIYISIEGPRPNETGAESNSVGSARQAFWMSDIVPYFGGDVPTVFAGGNLSSSQGYATVLQLGGHISRNYAGTAAWSPGRLMTLGMAFTGTDMSTNFQRQTVGDGKYYLSPYVAVSDTEGLRGRLAAFFHAGYMLPGNLPDQPQPPVGSKVSYDGNNYKLWLTQRSGINVATASAFGYGGTNSGLAGGPVVAIPCT